MKIAVLGGGRMGGGLARAWAGVGHEVVVGLRDPSKAAGLGQARAVPLAGVAAGADVAVLAVPWGAVDDVLAAAGELTGRVLIDVTNPFNADFTGLRFGFSTSAAEQLRDRTGARVVKAFNTVFQEVVNSPDYQFGDQRACVYVASDDDEARAIVARLADEIGFQGVQCGSLDAARYLEPMCVLNVRLAAQFGSQITLNLLKR